MYKGNVTNVMKPLTDNMQKGILPLNKKTLNQLKQKHPQGKEAELEGNFFDRYIRTSTSNKAGRNRCC